MVSLQTVVVYNKPAEIATSKTNCVMKVSLAIFMPLYKSPIKLEPSRRIE